MSDLLIYPVVLETVALLREVLVVLERLDPDLANQLRRAAASMALNASEGAYSRGGNKKVRYHSALGSAREALSCIEVAVAFGHVVRVDEEIASRMRRIIGTFTNLAR